MTDAIFRRLDVTALQQLIDRDIDNIGEFSQEGDRVILADILQFTDGVVSGLLPTTDNSYIYIAANGRLLQEGIVGTSKTLTIEVNKPTSGTRTDIVVAQIVEEQENLEARLFLIDPDTEEQQTSDTYVESVQRVNVQIIEDAGIGDVPIGWILLATLDLTATTVTVNDERNFSTAQIAGTFFSDVDGYIDALIDARNYITGTNIKLNNISVVSNATTLDFTEGTNVVITVTESPTGEGNITISVPDVGGTIDNIVGTSGTVSDPSTLQFAAGTGVTSINVTESPVGTAVVTINASGGGGGGPSFQSYAKEEKLASDGVLTGGKYRYTLSSITVVDENLLNIYAGGNHLEDSEYIRITDNIIDVEATSQPTIGSNSMVFEYMGDGGSLTGFNVSGTAGAGATDVQNINFTAGLGIQNITVTETGGDTAQVNVEITNALVNGSSADGLHTHPIYAGNSTSLRVATGNHTAIFGSGYHDALIAAGVAGKVIRVHSFEFWANSNTIDDVELYRISYASIGTVIRMENVSNGLLVYDCWDQPVSMTLPNGIGLVRGRQTGVNNDIGQNLRIRVGNPTFTANYELSYKVVYSYEDAIYSI